MQDEEVERPEEKSSKGTWVRNLLFLGLGVLTLLLGSFLLTDQVGPEALFVLLLWLLPLFVH